VLSQVGTARYQPSKVGMHAMVYMAQGSFGTYDFYGVLTLVTVSRGAAPRVILS